MVAVRCVLTWSLLAWARASAKAEGMHDIGFMPLRDERAALNISRADGEAVRELLVYQKRAIQRIKRYFAGRRAWLDGGGHVGGRDLGLLTLELGERIE